MDKHPNSDESDPMPDAEDASLPKPASSGEAPTVEFSYVEGDVAEIDEYEVAAEIDGENDRLKSALAGVSALPPRRETLVSLWVVLLLLGIVVAVLYRYRGAIYADIHDPNAIPRVVTPRGELSALELTQIQVFQSASPSVVHIMTEAGGRHLGIGTGFVWSETGYIVTNNHVIAGAESAYVTLADNRTFTATFVGRDPAVDLAVLKIPAEKGDLMPIPVGESAGLKVGQSVYAIGSPFGLDQTLTSGIISGLGRTIDPERGVTIYDAIQTDAAINRGNSGGPLLDSAARLIGVNVMIVSESGANSGVGFSVPVDTVNRVVPELIRNGAYERPALGVSIYREDQLASLRSRGITDAVGALITGVMPGSVAERAGLRGEQTVPGKGVVLGDLIVQVDETPIKTADDLIATLSKHKVGDTVQVKFIREEQERMLQITLEPLPGIAVE